MKQRSLISSHLVPAAARVSGSTVAGDDVTAVPPPQVGGCKRCPDTLLPAVFLLMALLMAGTVSVPAAVNCAPAPGGLAAWWPAEGHAYDVIDGRFAVIQGGVEYSSGHVGRALSFDGGQKRVRVLESTGTDLSRLPRWTIEAWVRPASFANATSPMIYSEGHRIVTLGLQNTTGKLESWVNNDNTRRLFSTNALTLNAWNHVALVYEGGRRLLYLNGVLEGATNTPAITDDGSGASIGQSTVNDATTVFRGAVDELSLYNVALTATQIAAIHAAGTAGKCFNESPAPTFVLDPVSQTGFLGGTVTLTALAAGCPDINYQWLFNGNSLDGAAGFSLTLANLTSTNAGGYSLRATSPFGTTTSAVAQLIVPWCTEPPTNILAWWPADGSALDAIDHHDGAVWGNTAYGSGVAGAAFRFDGTNAYVAVPNAPELSPHVGANGEMTAEAWVKLDQLPQPDAVTSESRRSVLAKGGPGQWEYGLSITTAGVPEFYMWNLNGTTNATISGGQIITGQWHHVVATLKKGGLVRLYQDGQLVGTSTNFTGTTGNGNAPLYLGRRGDAQFLNGWVDEAALYSRALTGDEVLALYAADGSGKCAGASSPAPYFVRHPENQTGYLLLGAGLTSFAIGTPRPTYQWYRSNATEWVSLPGQTNGTLAFTDLAEEVEGNYRVVAASPRGTNTSESAYLRVIPHDLLTGGETFEKGWNGWETDGAVWEVGAPTSGPGAAHSSSQVAATDLGGNYAAFQDSRLISPPVVLPGVGLGEVLQVRYWEWFSYSSFDFGYTQISVFNPTNGQWGGWVDLHRVGGVSSTWSPQQVDISAYAGRRVRLAFFHTADRDCCSASESSGWYLDGIEVWKGVTVFANPNTFEMGWGDWYSDHGQWQIGIPTSGPGRAHTGGQVAATDLGGDYAAFQDSRLISPPVVLPGVGLGEVLQVRYWEWFSYSSFDFGYTQISVFNPTNGQWGGWVDLHRVGGVSSTWSPQQVDISAYAGRRVRLAFFHTADRDCCNASESSGWYLDGIFIKRGNLAVASISDQTVNEHATLTFPVTVIGTTPDSCVSYQLIDPPAGATIDPTSGVFSWTPEECQGPGVYNIGIYVVDFCNNEGNDLGFVKVTVNEVNEPPWLLSGEATVYAGRTNAITLCSGDSDCPRNPLTYSLLAPVPAGVTIDPSNGVVRWTPTLAQIGAHNLRVRLCDGGSPNFCVTNSLTIGVTTNEYGLEIQHLSTDDVRFTLHDGSLAVDYILEQAEVICGCPCETVWEDVGRVSPTEMPYVFERAMDRRYRFFRLRETPRLQ